ncbi:hypothetical protein [Alienimonas californiensis]|uniref:Carbohydrate-binding domain-containing protein n=1 Tax=Alienimonas californiensis TaxID=2527989 RepID=A0A517PDB5_9PLAN|nr:hypothetical protein [Alienimonas californiensis]QDT17366.1 hypothetical protein CA12_34870 [Alienimonas californiensis]
MPSAVSPSSAPPNAATASGAGDRPAPAAFLFRFELNLPRLGDGVLEPPFDLPDAALLPHFGGLDDLPQFAEIRVGWTPAGLAVAVAVSGKSAPPEASAKAVGAGDGLHLWIDTRPTGTSHRAGRYCRRFALLPRVGKVGKAGAFDVPMMKGGEASVAEPLPIPLKATVERGGDYRLAAFLPAEELPGFDPSRSATIALHTVVIDGELGTQPLTVSGEFPTGHDPSLWTRATLGG